MSVPTIQVSRFIRDLEPTTEAQENIRSMIEFVDSIRYQWEDHPEGRLATGDWRLATGDWRLVTRRNPFYIGYVALKIATAFDVDDYEGFEKEILAFTSDGVYEDPYNWATTVWYELQQILVRRVLLQCGGKHVMDMFVDKIEPTAPFPEQS